MAKTRSLTFVPSAEREYQTSMPNLLVAGCSYVWNNSEEHACTWPYYIKDIMGFSQVFDCSQSGSGPDNVFNSIVNELTINPAIDKDNTLIVVMWPELTRTDVVAETDIVEKYHHMSLYHFNDRFSNLSIFNGPPGNTLIDQMAKDYKKIVSPDAQEYQSLIKIIALSGFLQAHQFNHVFLTWKKIDSASLENHGIPTHLINKSLELLIPLIPLDDYAELTGERISIDDSHPNPDAHIDWSRKHLAPCLYSKFPDIFQCFKGVVSIPRGT